ncbi:B-cell receptor CD22-like [Oreochromis niloticus]|uniref:B-cell receptor CD22-like n=1 Tax=Oreochromis niloticus TaxID=8128 RepID=A0A669C0T7_ORENI|nr:B-cell receptor CD22-like [Oreochromis niloticus]
MCLIPGYIIYLLTFLIVSEVTQPDDGAAMSLTAALRGFFIVLLSVSVVQSQNGWGVTYTSTQICAVKGSSVEIHCTYTYPPRINNEIIEVQKRLWFTKLQQDVPVDLKTDPNYDARVEYHFFQNNSTLRITDLRESDSAQYKFRFETNSRSGRYTGTPGVTLLVTDAPIRLSVSVTLSGEIVEGSSVTLTCSSDANPAASYTWYKQNDQKPLSKDSQLIFSSIQSSDAGEYYCIAVNDLGTKRTGHNIIIVNCE